MLVLTRKVGEQIVVPSCQVTVSVLGVVGKRVQLGIAAPDHVIIHRQEVQRRLQVTLGTAGDKVLTTSCVLIAEPDAFLLASYSSHLRQLGAAVITARTGLECLERLRSAAPDVLVLEPCLPWGGGDGVLTLLHEQESVRPPGVILLTQCRDRGLLYRMSSFKIDDYQTKPCSPALLAQRICALLLSLEEVNFTQAKVRVRNG